MPSQSIDQKTADAAFKHIALWEGFEDTVYADGGGVPHIGHGRLCADHLEREAGALGGETENLFT